MADHQGGPTVWTRKHISNFSHEPFSVEIANQLSHMGMSPAGAREALGGVPVSDARDRQVIASFLKVIGEPEFASKSGFAVKVKFPWLESDTRRS